MWAGENEREGEREGGSKKVVCEAGGGRREREREGIDRVSKGDREVKGGTCTSSKKVCVRGGEREENKGIKKAGGGG